MSNLLHRLVFPLAALLPLILAPLPASAQNGEKQKEIAEFPNPEWIGDLKGIYKRDKVRTLAVFNEGKAKRAALKEKPDSGKTAAVTVSTENETASTEEDVAGSEAGNKLLVAEEPSEPRAENSSPAWLWFVGGLPLGGVLIMLWRLFGSRFQRRGAIRVDTNDL